MELNYTIICGHYTCKKGKRHSSYMMQRMNGEPDFIKAYETYADAIFRFCYFRLFDRNLAHDATQETFTKTWEYITRGNRIDNIRAFLYRVARNVVIDSTRKKTAVSLDEMQEQGHDIGIDSHKKLHATLDARAILSIVEKLDEKYRDVILLRYVDGFTPGEIARILRENNNVISVRIYRGLRQLKEILEGEK